MANIYRLIRSVSFFLIGLFIGGYSVFSHAETSPAILGVSTILAVPPTSYSYTNTNSNSGNTLASVCTDISTGLTYSAGDAPSPGYVPGKYSIGQCKYISSGAVFATVQRVYVCPTGYTTNVAGYIGQCAKTGTLTCPTGQNWTLTGSTCTRPDCIGEQVRDAVGVCSCPTGKTLAGELCITLCPSGYHLLTPDNGKCEKDCFGEQSQSTDGKCTCSIGSKTYFTANAADTASLQHSGNCSGGCQYKAGFMSIPLGGVGVATTGKIDSWLTSATSTGSICEGNSTPGVVKATLPPPSPETPPTPEQPKDPRETEKNNSDPDSCTSSGGIYYSTAAGGKCSTPTPDNSMDKQKLVSSTKTKVITNPDGSTTTIEDRETVISDGQGGTKISGETKETTRDPGGNVTGVKNTKTDGAGNSSEGDGIKGFCLENPNSIICKTSSWSGNCEQAPSCDGDAVMCATARAVWEHRCVNKWAESSNALSDSIDQSNLFGDTQKAEESLNNNGAKDWDVLAKFQEKRQNYLNFSSSCSPDLSFDFKGQHYQFDTGILCQFGLFIKILLHLGAYMLLIRLLTVKLF